MRRPIFTSFLFSFLLLPATGIRAEVKPVAKSDAEAPIIILQQTDPQFPIDRLAGPGVEAKKLKKPDSLPSPSKRNRWIKAAGLETFTQEWDAFAKDRLVIDAHLMQPEQFRTSYSKADPEALHQLQQLVQKDWE